MEVKLTKNAKKGFKSLPDRVRETAFEFISALEEKESLEKWDVKKMSIKKFRVRLDYRHRLVYSVEKYFIKVTYIGTREGAYK